MKSRLRKKASHPMSTSLPPTYVQEAVAAIRTHTNQQPTIGLILGSGLNQLADSIGQPDTISYDEIPHWTQSTVQGHAGKLLFGTLENKPVCVMQGRTHFYEGHPIQQITLPIRVMAQLGVQILIVTNAAGGINPNFQPGDLMLITDHLNLPGMAGQNPLRGANDDRFGPRFPDMTEAYDLQLRQLAQHVATQSKLTLHEGVYAFVGGPSFETPAEIRFLQGIGADAVGMSTAPEVVVARHAGIRVLGISSITNSASPDPKLGTITNHEEVLEVGKLIVPRLTQLLQAVLQNL